MEVFGEDSGEGSKIAVHGIEVSADEEGRKGVQLLDAGGREERVL